MNDTDVAFASIEEIGKLFRKRKLSPVELTKLMLARIEHLNPKLNAYITVTAELALAQAKKAESELFAPRGRKGHRDRGPLHGIPISLKDNIYTEGIRTTAGSKILKDFIPQHDAQVVMRSPLAIPGTPRAFPVAPVEVLPPPLPPAFATAVSARTPAAPSAFPHPSAGLQV